MKPREQALEILFEYKYENNFGIEPNTGIKALNFDQAKECALITVNRMITVIDPENNFQSYMYWNEVKKEIEKL